MLKKYITRFFEFADYYCIDLGKKSENFPEQQIIGFEFIVVNEKLHKQLITFNHVRGEKYVLVVQDRLSSGQYNCFAFIEKSSGKIAYTRWLCINEFLSDILKESLEFKPYEAFTLDSYTPLEYRGKGLHKEMNVRMLNYLKSQTEITKVYMVIRWFYPYLHKVVKDLGYIKLRSKIYYKKGSIKQFIKLLYNKLIK